MTTTESTPSLSEGIVETDALGLDLESERCWTCDCRYCGLRCHAAIGTQYVVGIGYRTPEVAARWAAAGREARPGDEGWVTPRSVKRSPAPEALTAAEIERRLSDLTTAQRVAIELGVPADIVDMFEAAIVDHSDMLNHVYSTGR